VLPQCQDGRGFCHYPPGGFACPVLPARHEIFSASITCSSLGSFCFRIRPLCDRFSEHSQRRSQRDSAFPPRLAWCNSSAMPVFTISMWRTSLTLHPRLVLEPWAAVVLEADINLNAGIQYDRTANFWLGPVNIYFRHHRRAFKYRSVMACRERSDRLQFHLLYGAIRASRHRQYPVLRAYMRDLCLRPRWNFIR